MFEFVKISPTASSLLKFMRAHVYAIVHIKKMQKYRLVSKDDRNGIRGLLPRVIKYIQCRVKTRHFSAIMLNSPSRAARDNSLLGEIAESAALSLSGGNKTIIERVRRTRQARKDDATELEIFTVLNLE